MGGGDGVRGRWGAAAEASFAWEPELETHATLDGLVEVGRTEGRGLEEGHIAVQICRDGLQIFSNCSKWRRRHARGRGSRVMNAGHVRASTTDARVRFLARRSPRRKADAARLEAAIMGNLRGLEYGG